MLPQHTVMADNEFWLALDKLVVASSPVVDRPKGSLHPRHPSYRYPLDYGHLKGTRSPDGDGIDVWIGSLERRSPTAPPVTGIIVTVDLDNRDAEFKILLGCTAAEAQIALSAHNRGLQAAILVERNDTREDDGYD